MKCTDCRGNLDFSQSIELPASYRKAVVYACVDCGRLHWQHGGIGVFDVHSRELFLRNSEVFCKVSISQFEHAQ